MNPDLNASEAENADLYRDPPLSPNPRSLLILQRLVVTALSTCCLQSLASDYEVKGVIRQTIFSIVRGDRSVTNDFTVTVNDCAWSIKILSDAGMGIITERKVASTNGVEIYDYVSFLRVPDRIATVETNGTPAKTNKSSLPVSTVQITTNGLPIGANDGDIVGHLWLMFASSCYWASVQTNWLAPVYDYNAAAELNPNLRVKATWVLLGNSNSLPREVTYLDNDGVPVGAYSITGGDLVGDMAIPTSFLFEEHRGSSDSSQGLVLHKRVEAEVTTMSAIHPAQDLIPMPYRNSIGILGARL
jgi:hypothetical protein